MYYTCKYPLNISYRINLIIFIIVTISNERECEGTPHTNTFTYRNLNRFLLSY